MDRVPACNRREYALVELAPSADSIWAIAASLEERAKLAFPPTWVCEIRVSQIASLASPFPYKVRAVSTFGLDTYPFQALTLSPATSRPGGYWCIRAFKIIPPAAS